MAERKQYAPGEFCWVELATTRPEAATEFYAALFGWEAVETPASDSGVYTMLRKKGEDVCGLAEMSPRMREQGLQPQWQSYVSVGDADEAAEEALRYGARLEGPPFGVLEAGRMVTVHDPAGARFHLWQPRRHIGAARVNEPGAPCWNELHTRNTARAAAFYTKLFDWEAKKAPAAVGGEYTEFRRDGRAAAGMLEPPPEWGELDPHWQVYFAVADLEATLAQAAELGGEKALGPLEIRNTGVMALIEDPQGARFAVIELRERTQEREGGV